MFRFRLYAVALHKLRSNFIIFIDKMKFIRISHYISSIRKYLFYRISSGVKNDIGVRLLLRKKIQCHPYLLNESEY